VTNEYLEKIWRKKPFTGLLTRTQGQGQDHGLRLTKELNSHTVSYIKNVK